MCVYHFLYTLSFKYTENVMFLFLTFLHTLLQCVPDVKKRETVVDMNASGIFIACVSLD